MDVQEESRNYRARQGSFGSMNILVYPHEMVMGGSQINAIELAAAVMERGHNVTVVAPDGVLVKMVRDLGLPYIATAAEGEYPSVRTSRQLVRLVRRLDIDLLHAYEWRPALEATFGPHLFGRIPLLITILSMYVSKFLPVHVPQIIGTRDLKSESLARQVILMEPPIDTQKNCPVDVSGARQRLSIDDGTIVVSVICRLSPDLDKLPGVLSAVEVIADLAKEFPVKLLIAGDGAGKSKLDELASLCNRRLGKQVIRPLGQMMDPTDAYQAADIVLGMGSSVMRGMAFSKPVIVQGEQGFWRRLDEESVETFLQQGWFGRGGNGALDLQSAIRPLLERPSERLRLGKFGRDLVVRNFSLNVSADRLVDIYRDVCNQKTPSIQWLRSMSCCAGRAAKFRAAMAVSWLFRQPEQ